MNTTLLVGDAAMCSLLSSLELCAQVDAGTFRVTGFGVDEASASGRLALAAGVRLRFSQVFSESVLAAISADFSVPLVRHEVVLNREPIWTTKPFSVALGLDLAAVFR